MKGTGFKTVRELIAKEEEKILHKLSEYEKAKSEHEKLKGIDIEELRQKLLDLKDEKRTVKLLLESDSELAENVEFMKEAIEIDETCIIFDKTNNPEIYIEVLSSEILTQIEDRGK